MTPSSWCRVYCRNKSSSSYCLRNTYCCGTGWGSCEIVGTAALGLLLLTGPCDDQKTVQPSVRVYPCMFVTLHCLGFMCENRLCYLAECETQTNDTWVCVCVFVRQDREWVTLTLLLDAGTVAMAMFARGRGGKLVSPSSRGGDGWRGGDWLDGFYTNMHTVNIQSQHNELYKH